MENSEQIIETFYFPLTARRGDNYRDELPQGDRHVLPDYAKIIRTLLIQEQLDMKRDCAESCENLAEKLIDVEWDVEIVDDCLYGVVRVTLSEKMTDVETEIFMLWCELQNRYGIGDRMESNYFYTTTGPIFISFSSFGDGNALRSEEAFFRG